MIQFAKYQATGNDFVMIDNRTGSFNKNDLVSISKLCDRRFGVGADGLVLIEENELHDFEMIYFNADGTQSLCGNGSRAAVAFTRDLGMIEEETQFLTISGVLTAEITEQIVHLRMPDVKGIEVIGDDYILNTGSPHYVKFIQDVENLDIDVEGHRIRHNPDFKKGINANFVEELGPNEIFVRTYERGVEAETLSCGTGVTACALAGSLKKYSSPVSIVTKGGKLKVFFEGNGKDGFKNIFLVGPAEKVFEGEIALS